MRHFVTEKTHLLGIYPVTVGYFFNQPEIDRPDGLGMNQIFVVSGGEGKLIMEGETINVKRGDMFFLRENTPHYYAGNDDFKTTFMSFDGDLCDKIFEFYEIGDWGVYLGKGSGAFEAEVKKLYEGSRRKIDSLMLSAYAHKIAAEFFEEALRTEITPIEQVKNFIEANYNKPLNLDDIMTVYPYSKAKLCRDFSEEYGMTVFEMITKIRLEHADMMLKRDPRIGLKTVSERSGYNDVSYFCRLYKRYFKRTARQQNYFG